MELYNGDCIEVMKSIPDDSVNLVLTDPPYNIAVKTTRAGVTKTADWDKIDGYIDWCIEWLKECQRILKPNGGTLFVAQRYGTNCTAYGSHPKKHKFSIHLILHLGQRSNISRKELGQPNARRRYSAPQLVQYL